MMTMLWVLLITSGLVALCLYIHYTVLRTCARLVLSGKIHANRPLLLVMMLVVLAHLAEVILFAFAYYAMHWSASMGELTGVFGGDPSDLSRYFYFSISSYTTLGVGDIVPIGAIRILAGIEALTGLMLIAWSASFSYFMMEKLWDGPSGE